MENEDKHKDDEAATGDLPPIAPKKQTRKERSKANKASQKSSKQQKHSLWRNWKSLSRTRQVELSLSGLIAIGGVGYLVAYVAVSIWQANKAQSVTQIEHAPLVINSRPPELVQPFTCDPKNGLRTGNMRTFVKNVGNARAIDVNPYINIVKLVPEQKTGNAFFDDLPIVNCDATPTMPETAFTLAPGMEVSPQIRQMVMSVPPVGDSAVQLYFVSCVYYSADFSGHHGTCDTYRLTFPSTNPLDSLSGTPTFVCDGKERIGRFASAITGHCQK